MNRPEHELARNIVQHLDHGVDQMDAATRDRLAAARRAALAHYREKPQTVLGLAWTGHAAGWFAEHHRLSNSRLLAAATALLIAVAGIAYWQHMKSPNEIADIDMSLLTDELPINAYLDKGFDSWLKRSPR